MYLMRRPAGGSCCVSTGGPRLYTLSLHDALPIFFGERIFPVGKNAAGGIGVLFAARGIGTADSSRRDRKSTRLNSSHRCISYAVFCLKKKNKAPGGGRHPARPTHSSTAAGRD